MIRGVCHCPACDGLAPDDELDEDTAEERQRRQDAADDAADAHFDRLRDERDRP